MTQKQVPWFAVHPEQVSANHWPKALLLSRCAMGKPKPGPHHRYRILSCYLAVSQVVSDKTIHAMPQFLQAAHINISSHNTSDAPGSNKTWQRFHISYIRGKRGDLGQLSRYSDWLLRGRPKIWVRVPVWERFFSSSRRPDRYWSPPSPWSWPLTSN
jgi:hypothetical protein